MTDIDILDPATGQVVDSACAGRWIAPLYADPEYWMLGAPPGGHRCPLVYPVAEPCYSR